MAILKNTEKDSVKSSDTSVFYMRSKRCDGLFTSACFTSCIQSPLCSDDYQVEKKAKSQARAFLDAYYSNEENKEPINMNEDFD